jgi:hypothetical protein
MRIGLRENRFASGREELVDLRFDVPAVDPPAFKGMADEL